MKSAKDTSIPKNSKSTEKNKLKGRSPSRNTKKFTEKFNFSEKEIHMIRKRFDKLSKNSLMNKKTFREGLGLLGLEHAAFLCDRIFDVIDENNNKVVSFDEFLQYMHILIDGDHFQKARQSFRMLDIGNKGKITYQDIEKMIYGISILWNSLTGAKVFPSKQYINRIFKAFDQDGDGVIEYEEYYLYQSLKISFYKVYIIDKDIFGWFDFLNQEDTQFQFWLTYQNETENEDHLILSKDQDQTVENKLSFVQEEIAKCMDLLAHYDEKEKTRTNNTLFSSPRIFSDYTQTPDYLSRRSAGGPSLLSDTMTKKDGDDTPGVSLSPERGRSNNRTPTLNLTGIGKNFNGDHTISDVKSRMSYLVDYLQKLKNESPDRSPHSRESSPEDRRKKSADKLFDPKLSPIRTNTSKFNFKIDTIRDNFSNTNNLQSPIRTQRKSDTYFRIAENNKRDQSIDAVEKKRIVHLNAKHKIKKNISVFFGHENWNLVLNMMIGIRASTKSVYRIRHEEDNKINDNDFKLNAVFELIQQRTTNFDSSRLTCRFTEFAPLIFDELRTINGITSESYLRSVGPENLLGNLIIGNMSSLTEQTSSGKSGSFFYFTQDSKFMLKTITKKDFIFFKSILKPYFFYLSNNPQSLLTRIYGLYNMVYYKRNKLKNLYFIVMANLFDTQLNIDVQYDLKGSLYGRTSRKPGKPIDEMTILKDLDFLEDKMKLDFNDSDKLLFAKTIEQDANFLASQNINDYSLLFGVHFKRNSKKLETDLKSALPDNSMRKISLAKPKDTHTLSKEINYTVPFHKKDEGGLYSKDKSKVFLIGIIDYLTDFGAAKKLEYGFKRTFLGKKISCVPPKDYGARFKKFLISNLE